MTLPSSLKAIARAGAGVNNIPIDKCSGLSMDFIHRSQRKRRKKTGYPGHDSGGPSHYRPGITWAKGNLWAKAIKCPI